MNIALYGRSVHPDGKDAFDAFFGLCNEHQLDVYIFETLYQFFIHNEYQLPTKCISFQKNITPLKIDFAFSIGGDGTFLRTARLIGAAQTPIVGINTGRLGFLADIRDNEIAQVLKDILSNNIHIEERSVLKLREKNNTTGHRSYALNDIAVLRRDTSSLIVVHVYVGTKLLNSFWADGLIISTPTGSTAYSMSAGGPIVVPETKNFILTPIAPHSLTVRPIVIPDSILLRLEIESRSASYMISIDSKSKAIPTTTTLFIEKGEYPVRVVQSKSYDFYDTLRKKLMWGKDIRTSNR